MAAAAIIREQRDGDSEAVARVITAAFGKPDEAHLVDSLKSTDAAAVSLVAKCHGEIVGHVLLSVLDAPMPSLALAPLAVAPSHQRQGIGSALVRSALAEARERGWSAIFVLGHPDYYSRFGFDVARAGGYRCRYAGRHFMIAVLRPPVPARGQISYPAAFDVLDD